MDGLQDHGAKSFKNNSIASPKQSRNNQLERPQWQYRQDSEVDENLNYGNLRNSTF